MTAGSPQAQAGRVVEHPEACLACGHVLAAHDPIGQRYCAATVSAALTRRCICRPGTPEPA